MADIVAVRHAAIADIARIEHSIAEHVSAISSRRWRSKVELAIRMLAKDARSWPEADEAALLELDLRCRTVGRGRHVYRVLFTVDGGIRTGRLGAPGICLPGKFPRSRGRTLVSASCAAAPSPILALLGSPAGTRPLFESLRLCGDLVCLGDSLFEYIRFC